MVRITLGKIWEQDRRQVLSWLIGEAVALVLGIQAARLIGWGHLEFAVLLFYGGATTISIFAGHDIANRIWSGRVNRREVVAYLNDHLHKWFVVGLNGVVTAALCYRLISDAQLPEGRRSMGLIVLGIFITFYAWSYFSNAVRAHSVLARLRSVMLRVVLTVILAGMVWGTTAFFLATAACLPALFFARSHLLKEQKRWGWDTR